MGSYADYYGSMVIEDKDKDLFSKQMIRVLNYGGMMKTESLKINGHEMLYLRPVTLFPSNEVSFSYNYFEDDFWETACYDSWNNLLCSEKIGWLEFSKVILAAYTIYSLYDDEHGYVCESDDGVVDTTSMIAWLNHLLGLRFSKRESHTVKETRSAQTGILDERIPCMRTSDYLQIDEALFSKIPDELDCLPRYQFSDDDRLYWWDGSDEVIMSKEMECWLRELAERHERLTYSLRRTDELIGNTGNSMECFLSLLADIDDYYQRIYPFQELLYDFNENSMRIEYRAAIELLRELSEENKKMGEVIRIKEGMWALNDRRITHNPGRIAIKRYLSIMTNRYLRSKYLNF